MANNVYAQALGGLQNLVSLRAAERALRGALQAKGETSDTVDAEVMSRILLGPILSEFETIMPREGLKRQLRSLAANLRKNFPKAPEAVPETALEVESLEEVSVEEVAEVPEEVFTPPPVQSADFAYQTHALSDVPESLDLMSAASPELSTVQTPQRISEAVLREVPVVPQEPLEDAAASSPTSVTPSQEQLEGAVLRLAQLEQVKFVAALRAGGEVATQRGSGIDVDALAQLGLVGLKLLRRSGPLRAYYLAHTCGQLFLLPFGEDTLALIGTPELNVGAVFNTFTVLKEEL